MVQLGWSGILVPEEFGGSDFGIAGISVIMQELGKTLTPSPMLATSVLGVSAETPKTEVASIGDGVRVLPSSCMMTLIPAIPKSDPPNSSGTNMPDQPS